MKRLIIIVLVFSIVAFAGQVPFSKGVNLTGWFQASGVRQVQFSKFTKQDFLNIQSLGCDVVRLPINLIAMSNGMPNYTLDPLFYYFLDQVIDWAEELGIYLILDYHATESSTFTDPNLEKSLIALWTQMAERYKNRSNHILYEVINEPHDIADNKWGSIQKNVIEAIRKVDQTHTIVVTGAQWGGYNALAAIPKYTDENLLYSFHFYDPFIFTHQGAGWTSPSLTSLAGVPFPYDPARMPACPPDLKGTWIENSLAGGYRVDGTEKKIKELIGMAIKFRDTRKVPVYCGEFGVYMLNAANEDRVRWYGVVAPYLTEQGIPWTMWDYTGGFGIFRKGGSDLFEHDVNVELVAAMGLNPPPQKEFILKPDSTGFDIYTDGFGRRIFESSWAGSGSIDFYNEEEPAKGSFCIKMEEVDQYCHTGFRFKPIKDLSELVKKGYALDIYLRTDNTNLMFDIRFIDTKTEDPNDHPWRMKYTVSRAQAKWDGNWKHLQIPLKNFVEGGSWDNAWYNPEGKFDWKAVNEFQIVAEHYNFKGRTLYIDHIRIVDPNVVKVEEPAVPEVFRLTNHPNPFNPTTTIVYELAVPGHARLEIFDLRGRLVAVLVDAPQAAGVHRVPFAAEHLAAGVYLCRLAIGDRSIVHKITLLR
ncbi:MAG: cellulase family glycosylhydrolase [candidate division KSB1 bacterium]|nr:cellulase family glycosylhydrolase [candidate division KSB1 bacterium]MDZ7345785.1 cellulase family glycosylhydrolase [candidate division KSB1 bacterium]